jgi:hypothetical protein
MEKQIQLLNLPLKYLTCILVFILSFEGCKHKGPEIAGVPFTQYYNNCPAIEYDFGETITIGDPNDKFMITLPYEWDIQETYTDTLYGMIVTNSTLSEDDPDAFLFLSVIGYQTADSLLTYFTKEVKTLQKDKTMKEFEAGKMDFGGRDSYWVKFESIQNDQTIVNVVKYIKAVNKNEIYLVQSSANKTGNFDEKICILKKLSDSFELVE